MRLVVYRWFLFGLLFGWALSHAAVFGQQSPRSDAKGTSAIDKLRQTLDKTVTIEYTAPNLLDALNHFKDKTGLTINVDPVTLMQLQGNMMPGLNPGFNPMPMQVQIKAVNEKAGQALRKLLNTQQLSYIIFEDAVLITTEDSATIGNISSASPSISTKCR